MQRAADLFLLDLSYLPEDQYNQSQGNAGRSPQEFVAECVGFNRLVRDALRSGKFGRPTLDAQVQLTEKLSNPKEASAALRKSVDEVLSVFGAMSDEALTKRVVAPWGERLTLLELVHDTASHMNYHGAQLTYIQSLHGDTVNHWRE